MTNCCVTLYTVLTHCQNSGFITIHIRSLLGNCFTKQSFIEVKAGATNRILNVSPGSLKGTSFTKGKTDLNVTAPMANEIIKHLEQKDDLFIPQYDEVFKNVLTRYHDDFRAEGRHSYEYKIKSGRY